MIRKRTVLPPELAELPELEDARVMACLRDLPQRRVYEIRLNGERAFLKQFRSGNPEAAVETTVARLTEVARVLGQDRNAVAEVLLAIPRAGVLVTHPATGQPLSRFLSESDPANRARLIARVGEWLQALARADLSEGRFGPGYWIKGLDSRVSAAGHAWIDGELVQRHLAQMQQEGAALRRARVVRARLHGDLTPDNVFYDPRDGRLTGIDMQEMGEIALVRDMARMLVWLESRRDHPAGDTIDGIAAEDHRALCESCDLLAPDQRPLLRFMIGEIMLGYYLDCDRQPDRRRLLSRAMQGWAYAPDTSASAAS
ncbi:phosphotransferase [Paracoccus sp. MBLB3053]|uniref:Phosphotransferase n=1 Tax=Paracoccus aurantius TaxID=3073814 RepID=A0ABU2HSY0_9RHOB|nr:phosphotransferase [Paracoccus sp. MBLB3053]MDS9468141.1 phosphotransferase [Paracoccus sp. MBLB3053]